MLTERQTEIITGSLLGDGCIWNNFVSGCKLKLQIRQSKFDHEGRDKKLYIGWLAGELASLKVYIKEKTNITKKIADTVYDMPKKFYHYSLTTGSGKLWNDLEQRWYVQCDHHWYKRRKVVPHDIRLTPLALCVWYMDDGSNNQKDANITLETQGFTGEEVNFLVKQLDRDLGIKANLKWTSRGDKKKPRVYVGRKSYFEFIEMIRPHVSWDCFYYKLDTTKYTKKPHRGETHSLAKLTEEQVKEVIAMAREGTKLHKIAEHFNINRTCVSGILSGRTWKHIVADRPITENRPRISQDKRAAVLAMKHKSQSEIAKLLGINQSSVSRILKKESYA